MRKLLFEPRKLKQPNPTDLHIPNKVKRARFDCEKSDLLQLLAVDEQPFLEIRCAPAVLILKKGLSALTA